MSHKTDRLRSLQKLNATNLSSSLKISTASQATQVFDRNTQLELIPNPNIYSQLLRASINECSLIRTHQLFDETPQRRYKTSRNSKIIHTHILKFGLQSKGKLGNALVDLYAKCGNLDFAQKAFDRLEERDCSAYNSILSLYLRRGSMEDMVRFFGLMRNDNVWPDQFTLAMVLSCCGRLMALEFGRQVHCEVIKMGYELNRFCYGSLIDMYAKCNFVIDARRVFGTVIVPDTISWTAMIAGYVRIGLSEEALELFFKMQRIGGSKPDQVVFVTVITACVSLGRLEYARGLFTQMSNPNVVAWNVMISGHAQHGYETDALFFFHEMRKTGVKSTRSTLGSVLSVIANLTALDLGQQVHSEAIRLGLDSNVFVGSSLINMYAKCSVIESARQVFDAINEKNIVMWNAMLGGYAQNGHPCKVMELFSSMKGCGFQSDEFTYASVLSVCACFEGLDMGQQLHSIIVKRNFENSLFVGNALVDMYAKSGDLRDARRKFEFIQNRDTVSFNAIIVGYVHDEDENEALFMFRRMNTDGIAPDEVSLASVLSACGSVQFLEEGKQIHCFSIKSNFESNLYVGSSLVDMYAKCGVMEAAKKAFAQMPVRSLVSMNALISGHIQNNNAEEAVTVFRLIQAEGLTPSLLTLTVILPACSGPSRLSMGRQVHCYTQKSGLLQIDLFLGVSLLGMYLKSQNSEDANKLFSDIPDNNNTVLWTATISGHSQSGYSEEALCLFRKMHSYGARPDQATFASVLKACASLSTLRDGKAIHCLIIGTGFISDEYTSSSLIDMYSKCGDVRDSMRVFEEIGNKQDVISWNSMIVGLAKNGYAEDALGLFNQMQKFHVEPDDITFLGVLTGCSHAGLVSEGLEFFELMSNKYRIQPRADHYACIIDLLGRSGHLKEAEEFIKGLPFEPDSVIWATLLAASRIHGDDMRGRRAAEKLIELEPQNSSPYVLLSNIYAATGNWERVNIVRKLMRERGVKKLPGCSWIVVGTKTHLFVAGDKFHPNANDIYAALNVLTALMKEDGYVVGLDLDEE